MVVSPNAILDPTIPRPIAGFVPASPPVISNSIQSVLDSHSVVLIHFWAAWNGADPPMDSQLALATKKLPFAVHVASCNIDDPQCLDLCKRCGVVNIPYVGVFVDGELRPGIMGLRGADQIATLVTESSLSPFCIRNRHDRGGGSGSAERRRTIACTGAAVASVLGNQSQIPPPRDAGRSELTVVLLCALRVLANHFELCGDIFGYGN